MDAIQDSLFGKTCPELSPPTKAMISTKCYASLSPSRTKKQQLTYLELTNGNAQERSWQTNGVLRGEYWTRNFSEYPNDASGSSLSQILQPSAPDTYSLSPRACAGILRRAAARGKPLPPILHKALTRQATNPKKIL